MSGGNEDAWAQIKLAYDDFELTVPQIAERFGVTRVQINYRRRRDNWARRPINWNAIARSIKLKKEFERKKTQHGNATADARNDQAGKRCKSQGCGNIVDRPSLVPARSFNEEIVLLMDRLLVITKEELSTIEDRMTNGEIRTAADTARNTRSIGALIKNLEKLTEFNEQHRGGDDKSGSVAGITADEADAIRRDLAQRIERITKG